MVEGSSTGLRTSEQACCAIALLDRMPAGWRLKRFVSLETSCGAGMQQFQQKPFRNGKAMSVGKFAGVLLGVLATLAMPAWARAEAGRPWMDAKLMPDVRATLVEKEMTQAEKLQLVHGYFAVPVFGQKLPAGALGSAGYVPGIERLGIPALQESDASLGVANPVDVRPGDSATALPSGLALASTFDPRSAYAGGAMIGHEAWSKGLNVLLAGGANLARDPRNGRNFEYVGEDPLLTGTLSGATIRGIQDQHVLSTVKHFALNDQETGRFDVNSVIAETPARESDLLAFELAIEAGNPGSVMCSYNLVNGAHACSSAYLLNDVLKHDWSYPGFVMSDWGAVHGVDDALAGLDQESGQEIDKQVYFGTPLADALKTGKVPQARLDDMVHRILRSMFAVGLFDHPAQKTVIDYNADAAVAGSVAEKGIVLLKNGNNLLPLTKSISRIAVIGGHADQGVLSGAGSSQVVPHAADGHFTTVPVGGEGMMAPWANMIFDPDSPLAAIRARAPNATVRFDTGRYASSAAILAKWADMVIIFATQWQIEGTDVPDLSLPGGQDALIAAVAAANPHTIVVLETGDPVAMPWLDKVAGLIEAWYPGQRGGQAIAGVLFGDVDPSGHLPITFPRDISQNPRPQMPGAGLAEGTPFNADYNLEGAEVGYRWFADKGMTPLFPFGFGLSYTSFGYSNFQVRGGSTLTVSFDVANTGKVVGDAVPQVYLTAQAGKQIKRLIGFSRVSLAPGQTQHVTLSADQRLLGNFDAGAHVWRVAAGNYTAALARSADDIVASASAAIAEASRGP